jgi:hypothetical protein
MTSEQSENQPVQPENQPVALIPGAPLKQTPLPDVGDIIFLAMIFLTLFMVPNFVFLDGSTGWHLAVGDYVLKHGGPPTKDFLSWSVPAVHPWVAYEWLSDTIMAFLTNIGGTELLAVFVCSAISLLFFLIYEKMRKEGCHFATALILTIVGAFTSAVHWLARPHLFTFFGVYIFTTRLEDRYKGTISGAKFFLPLTLYMLLWVNCHPGFLIGFALIGLYAVCSLAAAFIFVGEKRKEFLGKARDFTIAGVLCLIVSFVNPYGVMLYKYIAAYLRGSNSVIQATSEFLAPNLHELSLSPACLLVLFASFTVALAISKQKLTFAKLMGCMVFTVLALQSVRHMPLYAIMVLPALGELFRQVRPISSATTTVKETVEPGAVAEETSVTTLSKVIIYPMAKWWSTAVAKLKEAGDGFNENEAICQMHIVPIVTFVGLACLALFVPNNGVITSNFDPKEKPWYEQHISAEKPAGTLNYLLDHERSGDLKINQGINYDNWGGYLYYIGSKQKPPIEQQVFIDDRADYYGEAHYMKFAKVSQVETDYEKVLRDFKINWVLFPYNSKIVAALKKNPEWQEVSHDKASNLFVRKDRI